MTTEVHRDIPDYKRMSDEQCREIVKWALERGLLKWPQAPDLSRDLRPKPQRKHEDK